MVDWNVTGICGVGGKSSGVLLWFRTRKPTWSESSDCLLVWVCSCHGTVFDTMNRIHFVCGALGADQMRSTQQWTFSLQKQMRSWCEDYSVDITNKGDTKKQLFSPQSHSLLFPCTIGLYKWVVGHKQSLAEHKSLTNALKTFLISCDVEYIYIAEGNELEHRTSNCSQTLAANLCPTSSFDEYK